MKWNWQQQDWPSFTYDHEAIKPLEDLLLYRSGVMFGTFQHLNQKEKDFLKIEIIASEALKTSEIEGEYLNRDSLQSSILRQFGLQTDNRKIEPAERGVAELMGDLYKTYNKPLSHRSLHNWHKMLLGYRSDLEDIGCYRTSKTPMEIISGSLDNPKVHFEAPPSSQVIREMTGFNSWFNEESKVPALTKASIAHLYFESIHPFEDGNGRIGRAIAEKSLARSFGQPTLIALATTIEKNKKTYYAELERASKSNNITKWIIYFANVILEAQLYTQIHIEFLINKAKFFEKHRNSLNARQEKVLIRMFKEGPEGFKGGLSAENYLSIAITSSATTTRDLHELVQNNILKRTGKMKYARYFLNLE